MNKALLLSGGIGSRIKSDVPKQYIKVGGQMMIMYSLMTLAGNENIDGIRIVAHEKWHDVIYEEMKSKQGTCPKLLDKFDGFSAPGSTRQLSIVNGLEDMTGSLSDDDVVLIHDAARPFVSDDTINALIDECSRHDGAMPVLGCKDTMYLCAEDGRVKGLLKRSEVVAGQAPEAFRFRAYLNACKSLFPDRILTINGSTEPAFIAGLDIVTVPGDEKNVKITTSEDISCYCSDAGC